MAVLLILFTVYPLTEENVQLRHKLEGIQYSSRFALGLFYPPGVSIDVPFVGKYVEGNPCIRWVSVDNMKRGIGKAEKKEENLFINLYVPVWE